uniref:Uncharacterized protein n=1 Tax=viral metagenome TaxID=1070528 RepID=A0A6M3J383_9ZZZZ
MIVEIPYPLCPICGMQSMNTNRICGRHTSIIYDKDGNIIDYDDLELSKNKWEAFLFT